MSSTPRRLRRSLFLVGLGATAAYFFDSRSGPTRRAAVASRLGELTEPLTPSHVPAGDEASSDPTGRSQVPPFSVLQGGPAHATWSAPVPPEQLTVDLPPFRPAEVPEPATAA